MASIFSVWRQILGVVPYGFPRGGIDPPGMLMWVWAVITSHSLALGVEMGFNEQPGLRLPSMDLSWSLGSCGARI